MGKWREVDRGQWRQEEEENEKQGGEPGAYHLVFQLGGVGGGVFHIKSFRSTEITHWKCPNKIEFII